MVREKQAKYASESLFRKRLRKFRSIKRGYYSFIIILTGYILSFFSPFIMNNKALIVNYEGKFYFPVLKYYPGSLFGLDIQGPPNYRELKRLFAHESKGNWVLMPPYPYGPYESLTDTDPRIQFSDVNDSYALIANLKSPKDPFTADIKRRLSPQVREDIAQAPEFLNPPRSLVKKVVAELNELIKGEVLFDPDLYPAEKLKRSTRELLGRETWGTERVRLNRFLLCDLWPGAIVKNRQPPTPPSSSHWFGTDDRGRDVFVRIAYGFNISLSFSLIVVFISYLIGVSVGASLGYFGGRYDIIMQRFIEIWGSIPFLYTVIVISSILMPNFALLVALLCIFSWVGMTYFIRGEFYREKAKDYVHAAIAMGASNSRIIFKHILPNALTPVIAFGPFAVVGGIFSLLSLDYLGFGLPPPTPSWGELIGQGMSNIFSYWLVMFPMVALFLTLLMVVFIGEAVREAFDPREYSRLR